jgi:TRAP-type C4-dicarboxylate transport system permease small subunit
MLIDKLPAKAAMTVESLNLLIGGAVGALLTAFAASATIRSYQSGAASQVIEWPEYFLWASLTVFSVNFTLLVLVRLAIRLAGPPASHGQR